MLTTTKHWQKNNDFDYQLIERGTILATLQLDPKSSGCKAELFSGTANYTIQRIGFWKSKLEVRDQYDQLILHTYPGKWYSNKSFVEYKKRIHTCELRNNPMAELVIKHSEDELLAYGLDSENGHVILRINEHPGATSDILLHTVLWFLFLPIAHENIADRP